jgi:hypothetical protein
MSLTLRIQTMKLTLRQRGGLPDILCDVKKIMSEQYLRPGWCIKRMIAVHATYLFRIHSAKTFHISLS